MRVTASRTQRRADSGGAPFRRARPCQPPSSAPDANAPRLHSCGVGSAATRLKHHPYKLRNTCGTRLIAQAGIGFHENADAQGVPNVTCTSATACNLAAVRCTLHATSCLCVMQQRVCCICGLSCQVALGAASLTPLVTCRRSAEGQEPADPRADAALVPIYPRNFCGQGLPAKFEQH
jgi:hypothetical protein